MTFALLAVLARLALVAHAQFAIHDIRWAPQRFAVAVDQAPALTEGGTPVVPVGTRVTIRALSPGERFTVLVVSPGAMVEHEARGSWEGTFDRPGGYRVRFGAEDRAEPLSQMDLLVSPGTSP